MTAISFNSIYDNIIDFKNNDSFDYCTCKLADYKPQDLYKSFISTFEELFKDKFDIVGISDKKALIYIDDTYVIIYFDNEQEFEDFHCDDTILNVVKCKSDYSAVMFYEAI